MKFKSLSLDKISLVGQMKVTGKRNGNKLEEELKHLNTEIRELELTWEEMAMTRDQMYDRRSRMDERRKEVMEKVLRAKDQEEKLNIDAPVLKMLRGEIDGVGRKTTGLFQNIMNEGNWLGVRATREFKSYVYDWRFYIGDHAFVQVATGVNRTGNNFRMEWNPNKVEEWERIYLYELLAHVELKRFTQLDLALDVQTNLSRWKIIDERERKQKEFKSGKGKLETRNCGTHYSDVEVKIYDKVKERKDRENEDIEGVWWRIEESIRGKAVEMWDKHTWFEGLRLVKGKTGYRDVDQIEFPDEMKAQEKAKIIACMVYPDLLDEFSQPTQRKIKKITDEIARVENIEEEFRPCDFVKKKKPTDLAEIRKALKQVINL